MSAGLTGGCDQSQPGSNGKATCTLWLRNQRSRYDGEAGARGAGQVILEAIATGHVVVKEIVEFIEEYREALRLGLARRKCFQYPSLIGHA